MVAGTVRLRPGGPRVISQGREPLASVAPHIVEP
jgi:hypothetical protein